MTLRLFSNFSDHGFVLDQLYWPTSEYYFQAQQFVGTPCRKNPTTQNTQGRSQTGAQDLRSRPLNA